MNNGTYDYFLNPLQTKKLLYSSKNRLIIEHTFKLAI